MKLNGTWQRALIGLLVVLMAVPVPVFAQNNIPAFRQEELDQMLAPIALYPDSLLAQILMAATYPLEVVQADRWVRANRHLPPEARNDALDRQNWDPSVKALTPFPDVLAMMSEKLDWTQRVGDAFLAQEQDVMATIQDLRAKAYEAGNLRTTEQQNVRREADIIVVEPANPRVVYVPVYNPMVVYGPWRYPAYPPYVVYAYPPPPAAAIATGVILFGAAVAVAVAWNHAWGHWDWGHRHVYVNVNRTVNINRTTVIHTRQIQTTIWQHDPVHRKGVVYRDPRAREKYAPANRQAVDSRRDYRGYDPRGPGKPAPAAAQPTPVMRPGPAVAKPTPEAGRDAAPVQRPAPQARPAPAAVKPAPGKPPAPAIAQPAPGRKPPPAVTQPSPQARQAPAAAERPTAQERKARAVSRPATPSTIYGVEQGNKARMESNRGRESLSQPRGRQGEAYRAAPASPRPAEAQRAAPAQKPAPAQGGQRQEGGGHGRR